MSTSHHGERERAKSRTKVKPILRKLTQSEKNSLDLDRPAAEQDALGIYEYGVASPSASRSSHDIGFVQTGRRGYHARSTSGTSQFSTATTGSGHRTGSFVHPFQQTPRPYTPPIAASYQNSLRESEVSHTNSPTVEEDEDQLRPHPFRSTSNLSTRTASLTGVPAISSPVITSTLPPNLRIKTQPSSSRLALATSHTSLHNSTLSPDIASPTDTMSPVSAIRTSMDKGFRIRSRSEVDTGIRAETIQEARRKFQEKEDAKEEKAAREEVRALEKRQQQEARRYERSARRSSASERTRSKRSKSDLTMQEKNGDVFVGRGYDSVPLQTPPFLNESFEQPRRTNTAKAKTHSAWTKFVMWLKTRWIRLKK